MRHTLLALPLLLSACGVDHGAAVDVPMDATLDAAHPLDVGFMGDVSLDVGAVDEGVDPDQGAVDRGEMDRGAVDATVPPPDAATELSYPEGPYGTLAGDVIKDLRFMGVDGAPYALSEARVGVRGILFLTAAAWCGTCRQAMPAVREMTPDLYAAGVRVIVGVYEDEEVEPAGSEDAARWAEAYQLNGPVVAYGAAQLEPFFVPNGPEKSLLIDAETMRLVRVSTYDTPEGAEAATRAWLEAL